MFTSAGIFKPDARLVASTLTSVFKNSFLMSKFRKYLSFNPNSAIEKKEYFSILISNCVAVEKNKR